MTDLLEQAYNAPSYLPQVEIVMGQDLVYPAVSSCITITHARTGPPQPYLVGVHLGMREQNDDLIQAATVTFAINELKAQLDTRSHYLTQRRPHVTFIIGMIQEWRDTVPAILSQLEGYVLAWQRRKGTQIVTFDFEKKMNPIPTKANITFKPGPGYQIEIVGEHKTRDGVTKKWTKRSVKHSGTWLPLPANL